MGSALAGESFTIGRYRPALGRTVSPGSAGLQMSTHQKHMATQGHSEQDLKPDQLTPGPLLLATLHRDFLSAAKSLLMQHGRNSGEATANTDA